jgi:hypothetical protein
MQYNSSRSDPNNETHAAVDFAGVTHGSTAVSCSSTASTYRATGGRNGCYTGTSDQWLMNGLTSFHKVRAEIEPMSASCSGTSPLLKLWIIPSSACTGGSPPAECTSITNNDAAFAPSSLPAGSVALTQCIPTPTPSSAYDQLYFGFTSNNNNNSSTNSTENLRLTNLHSGLF